MRESTLQDFIVPICRARVSANLAVLERLEGTAFFMNDGGIFLTAKHVLEVAEGSGTIRGLNVKGEDRTSNFFAKLIDVEFAPEPFDVAIGKVNYRSRSWFSPYRGEVTGWSEVATLGYPESALNIEPNKFNIHLRFLKGYVQRLIESDELPSHKPHPPCFELSFPIPNGLSGAPLFLARGMDRQELIGIFVKSFDSEVVIDAITEIEENGAQFKEKRSRVEQYGIAHSLLALLEWRPALLQGKNLSDVILRTTE